MTHYIFHAAFPLMAIALLVSPDVNAAESVKLTSEAILSGIGPYSEDMVWPGSIVLPPAWRTGFKSIASIQRSMGREQGACLSASTNFKKPDTDAAYFQAYLKLRAERARMSETDYLREEAMLRERIEGSWPASGSASLTWQVGSPQAGNEKSVTTELNIATCEGNLVGLVHTHPGRFSLPSKSDVANLLFAKGKKVSVVVSAEEATCVMVRGFLAPIEFHSKNFNFGPFVSRESSNSFEFQNAFHIHNLSITYRNALSSTNANSTLPTFALDNQVEVMSRLDATALHEFGGALYCGQIDGSLPRVMPYDTTELFNDGDSDQHALILAVKAMLIIMHRIEEEWLPQPTFPFTPTVDSGLLSYMRALPQAPTPAREHIAERLRVRAQKIVSNADLKAIFREVLALSDENRPDPAGGGFFMPDDRFSAPRTSLRFVYACMQKDRGKDFSCGITDIKKGGRSRYVAEYSGDRATGSTTAVHAFNDQKTGVWEFQSSLGGSLKYRGDLSHDVNSSYLRPQGQGMMEMSTTVFQGEFNDGNPKGFGLLTEKATGITLRATLDNGQWRVSR